MSELFYRQHSSGRGITRLQAGFPQYRPAHRQPDYPEPTAAAVLRWLTNMPAWSTHIEEHFPACRHRKGQYFD